MHADNIIALPFMYRQETKWHIGS
uniref:Uncharacterized protein n=1 Tax=Arundo donax TaxID=35708 RepID=A0A0A9BSU1_ARUDO